MESLSKPHETRFLQDLQQSPALWYKIHVFIYDLRHFREKVVSEARLEKVIDPLYIGPPYFKEDEAGALKSTMIQGKTLVQHVEDALTERLNRRDKKRVSSGDFRVCAAHDLAPILEKALGIDPKKLGKDGQFIRILETKGLELGDEKWAGLPKKSFNPADKKNGNRKSRKAKTTAFCGEVIPVSTTCRVTDLPSPILILPLLTSSHTPKNYRSNTKTLSTTQHWFFLFEDIAKPGFMQSYKTFEEVAVAGFSLATILNFVKLEDDSSEYNFFIHSNSMKAAVQLLTDKSVFVTYKLYCENDDVVTVIVRPADNPSPNSSQSPSAPQSLRQRRKVSGKNGLQSLFVHPAQPKPETKNLDAETLLPIHDLPESEKIVLDLGKGKYETFSASYIFGWIMAELESGKALEDIVVSSVTPKGRPVKISLTKDIWMKCLLRGPQKENFLEIFNSHGSRKVARGEALEALCRDYPDFTNNARMFSQDLKRFGSDQSARGRLLSTNHRFFLGAPYFSPGAVSRTLELPVTSSNLQSELEGLMEKKAERGQSDELCASHDLAPLYLRAFGMDWGEMKAQKLQLSPMVDPKPAGKTLRKRGTMETLGKNFGKLFKERSDSKGKGRDL